MAVNEHLDEETFTTDNEGNIISCPHCGTRHLRRDGWNYYKDSKKQMWLCYGCHRKTLKPKILQASPFTKETPVTEDLPVEEIIKFRNTQYDQKVRGRGSKVLQNIDVNIDGPIGIAHFGDPHVDDDEQILHKLCITQQSLIRQKDYLQGILVIYKTTGLVVFLICMDSNRLQLKSLGDCPSIL